MKRSALLLLCAGTLVIPLYARATTAAPATPPAPTAATGKSAAVKKNTHRTASAKKTAQRHPRHAATPAPAQATPTK